MATIDREQLVSDIKLYLPDANILTDDEILLIAEGVIAEVGDDESKYPEVLCKSLKRCALINKSKASVDDSGIKREKVGATEYEYFDVEPTAAWSNYIDSLKDLCPTFGYKGLKAATGMKINPSPKIKVRGCGNHRTAIL